MLSTLQSTNGGQPESLSCSGSGPGPVHHFPCSLGVGESKRAFRGLPCSPVDGMVNATRLSNRNGEPSGVRSQPAWLEGLGSYGGRKSKSWSAERTESRRALARGGGMAPHSLRNSEQCSPFES